MPFMQSGEALGFRNVRVRNRSILAPFTAQENLAVQKGFMIQNVFFFFHSGIWLNLCEHHLQASKVETNNIFPLLSPMREALPQSQRSGQLGHACDEAVCKLWVCHRSCGRDLW